MAEAFCGCGDRQRIERWGATRPNGDVLAVTRCQTCGKHAVAAGAPAADQQAEKTDTNQETAPDIEKMSRAELVAYATEQGIEDAEKFPNMEAIRTAIEEQLKDGEDQ